MAVLHDYVCAAHGVFEARQPHCPQGCGDGMVTKVFLQPVGTVSTFTRNADMALAHQVSSFGMSDVRTHMPFDRTTRASSDMFGNLQSLIPNADKPAVVIPNQKVGDMAPLRYHVAAAIDINGDRIK